MKQSIRAFVGILLGVMALSVAGVGCGGGTAAPGNQYTLEVQGMVSVFDPNNLSLDKSQTMLENQVLIGAAIVEIEDDFSDGIGVNIVDFNATAQTNSLGEIQLIITPNTVGSGLLYKRNEFGEPLGVSQLDLNTEVVIPESSDGTMILGALNFSATDPDPNKLPLLGNIPVINTLFQNQQREAEITELVILITPELIDVLD